MFVFVPDHTDWSALSLNIRLLDFEASVCTVYGALLLSLTDVYYLFHRLKMILSITAVSTNTQSAENDSLHI